MAKKKHRPAKDFNDASEAPLISDSHSYIIEPAYPEGSDVMTQMALLGNLKNDIAAWVLKKTGCLPSVSIRPPEADGARETIDIHCTPAFIKEVVTAFHEKIGKVTRIPTRDEIIAQEGPDLCWRRPRL
jgi:hypothetical protein